MITVLRDEINDLELENKLKLEQTEGMIVKIEEYKKEIYKSKGYIDDNTVSLEEQIKDLQNEIDLLQEFENYERQVYLNKQRLVTVMKQKVDKTNVLFVETETIFIKYYDSLKKVCDSGDDLHLEYVTPEDMSAFREEAVDNLRTLNAVLGKLHEKEEQLEVEMDNFNEFKMPVLELFEKEVEALENAEAK